jgi:DNA-binding XRE family transcriptional regulator
MGKNSDYVVGNGLVESYSSGSNVEHLSAYYELISQSKDLRVENNVTQTEMAEMLKIGQDKISNYEKGKISPRLDVYLKYLDYLGYSLQIVKKDDKAD